MKKWYFLACILVVLGVYHLVFDDTQQRMIDIFSHAKVGEVYNLSDFTKGSVYSLMGINYIDFHHPLDLEHNRESIVIWYGQGKQKVIQSEISDSEGESKNQVFLEADRREIPFGYRCPPNAKIQLFFISAWRIYWIKPLNCQSLDE